MKKILPLLLTLMTLASVYAKSYDIENLKIQAELKPSGDLLIEEEWTYNLEGGPFRKLYREVPDKHSDGIRFIEIIHDGEFLNPNNPQLCEVKDKKDLEMAVFLSDYYDRKTTVVWRYLINKPYIIKDDTVILSWTPLPDEYDFIIKKGTVKIINQSDHTRISTKGNKRFNPVLSEDGKNYIYSFNNLKEKNFTVNLDLPQEVIHLPQSEHGKIKLIQSEFTTLYAILGFGSVILILGSVFTVLALVVYRDKKLPYESQDLPESIHPLLIWKTIYYPTSREYNYGGELLNLIWKKVVVVDGQIKSAFKKDYDWHIVESIKLDNTIDMEFVDKLRKLKEEKQKPLLSTVKLMTQDSKATLGKLLHEEFFNEGLGYEELTKTLNRKLILSSITLIFSIILFIPMLILWEKGTGWSFIPPILIFDTAFLSLMFASLINTLSPEGKNVKATWRAYKHFISSSIRDKSLVVDEDYVKDVFPYFSVLGLNDKLIRYCKKEKIELPNILSELNFKDFAEFSAFYAIFISHLSGSRGSASGSSSGSAGGGSAGGGSAGAC